LRRAGKHTTTTTSSREDPNDFTLPSTAGPALEEKSQQDVESYTKSAEDHRDFLLDILQQTKDQLQQPAALLVPDRAP